MSPWLVLLLFAGCKSDPEKLMDTGWFVDTASMDPADCLHYVVETEPEDGEASWYWRDSPTLWGNTKKADYYSARLVDNSGFLISEELVWAEKGNTCQLALSNGLSPSSSYTLQYDDCRGQYEIDFSTSAFGTPLAGGPQSLEGATFHVDLVGADWVEPGGFAALMSLYFTVPILIGVQWADGQYIDLMGAPGYLDGNGQMRQNTSESTWDFPRADFSAAPYFVALTDEVVFDYIGVDIPVYDFELSATISADGSKLGGGLISGLGDTRHMWSLLGSDEDPNAICTLAASVGVSCQACPDSAPYCLLMRAKNVDGTLIEGLALK